MLNSLIGLRQHAVLLHRKTRAIEQKIIMSNLKTDFITYASKSLLVIATAGLFSGCAMPHAQPLATPEKLVSTLDELEQQRRENPDDLRLDATMYKQVGQMTDRYQQDAEQALAAGDVPTAIAKLKMILKYDGGNMRAQQTMVQLEARRYLQSDLFEAKALADSQPKEALTLINKVLEELPSWTDAIQLRDTLMRKIAESDTLSPSLDTSLKKPVSLNFHSHNLMSIFDTISKLAKVNFIFDAEVSKTASASISASKTTAEDVINLLLVTNQLRKKVLNRNTMLIYPARPGKDKEYRDMAVKTFFLNHAQAKAVSAALKMMLKIKDVYVDDRINAVVVRDAPETIELASRLVQALDRPEAEVMLDVQVLEVSSSDLLNLGIQYPQSIGLGIGGDGKTDPNIPLSLLSNLTKNNLFANLGAGRGVTLNMLQKATNAQVLANPKIRVKNGKKAQIEIGERIPVITNLMSDGGATSERVEMLDVGLKFDVLPTISLDGEITVDIDLTVSSLGALETSPKGGKYYRINQRKTQTTMTAKDNETQIMAGLISREERSNKSGLPGLSQMPLLDRLFGNRDGNKEKTEIVLVITPRIERKLELPGAHVTTFISGTESRVSADSLILRSTEGARVSAGPDAAHAVNHSDADSGSDADRAPAPTPEPIEPLPVLLVPNTNGRPGAVPPPVVSPNGLESM